MRRQRKVAAAAALLVAGGGALVSLTATPLYRARCRVVAAPVPQTAVAGGLPVATGENAATLVELLGSEALLRQAREAAKLDAEHAARFHVRLENTPGSDVVDVVSEGPQARGVAALANALVAVYVEDVDRSRARELESTTDFLEREQSAAQAELERVARRLSLLRSLEKGANSLSETETPALPGVPPGAKTPRLAALRVQIEATTAKIARLRRELPVEREPTKHSGERGTAASVLPDVWSRLSVLEERLRQQTAEYRELAAAGVQRARETEILQLERRRQAAQAALQSATERLVDVRSRSAGAGKPFRSVEPAKVPARPFWPDPRVQWMVTLLGAGIAGVAAAVVRERQVARVETADDVERVGLSLLGTVDGQRPPAEASDDAPELLDGLEFAGVGRAARVLLVLPVGKSFGGDGAGEGVARTLAASGHTVCWVDADLRPRSGPGEGQSGRRGLGLSQVLAGMRDEDQVLEPGEATHLWRIAPGPPPPNPVDLLGSPAVPALFSRLRERFEVLVVTAHPCLDRPDALRLASKVDGIVLAASCGRLRPAELRRAAELVREAGGSVVGVVLERTPAPGTRLALRHVGQSRDAPGIYRRGGRQDERG